MYVVVLIQKSTFFLIFIGAKRAGKVGVQKENSRLIQYYETKKTMGAPAPAAPATLVPLLIFEVLNDIKTSAYLNL